MSRSGNPNEAYWAKKFVAGAGAVTAPSFSFNTDPTSGIWSSTAGEIAFSTSGNLTWKMSSSGIRENALGGSWWRSAVSSATVPIFSPGVDDTDTGVGSSGADSLSLTCGAIEGFRLTEVSSKVIVSAATSANVGLTADVGSAQGNGVILASYNVYSVCANAGDAATLPAVFEVGTLIYVKNNGAASMDVFPASGDDAGAGANTAVAVANGNFAVFMGTTANATWTKIMGGTA